MPEHDDANHEHEAGRERAPVSEQDSRHVRSTRRQALLDELERQTDGNEINVDLLVKLYKAEYPGEAAWMLVHDIERQAAIWYNIAELIKSGGTRDLKKDFETVFRSIPENSLSNPMWGFDLDKAFDKMRNYCRGLVKISQTYALELVAEMSVDVGTSAIVQVQLGLPPSLTLGFEKSFSASAARGVTASRA